MFSLPDEVKKREFILSLDEFGEAESVSGLLGLARNIQTLMFLEQGTYPHNPEMGIGIRTYSFEFFDNETISILESSIDRQIYKYIPNNNIENIMVQSMDKQNSPNQVLGVKFNLSKEIDSRTDFIMLFDKVEETSTVQSQILI